MRTYNMTMPELTLPAIRALSAEITAEQDLNGYDKPWIGGAGKNLVPLPSTDNGWVSGFISSSGGVSSADATRKEMLSDYIPVTASEDYTFSVTFTDTLPDSFWGAIGWYDANKTFISRRAATSLNFTYDAPADAAYARVTLRTYGLVGTLQFEQGSTATAYEPYENICPISGTTEVKVTRAGKNLLKNTAVSEVRNGVTFTVNTDGSVSVQGTATAQMDYYFDNALIYQSLPDGDYFFSGITGGSTSTYRLYLRILNTTGSSRYVGTTGGDTQFTLTDESVRMFVRIYNGATVDFTVYPMIRLATETDDTYEPYKGVTKTIDLGQTVYGGTLDVVSGLLTVTHTLLEMDGTTTGKKFVAKSVTAGINEYYVNVDDGYLYGRKTAGYVSQTAMDENGFMCSVVQAKAGTGTADEFCANLYISSSVKLQPRIRFLTSDPVNTLTLANQWLATLYANGTPCTFWYKLASPQTYQLTPTQVETLAGSNTVMSDKTITLTFNGQTLTGQAVTFDAEGRRVVCMFMPTT